MISTLICLLLSLLIFQPSQVFASDSSFYFATVKEISRESKTSNSDGKVIKTSQTLKLEITSKDQKGQTVTSENSSEYDKIRLYKKGDKVILYQTTNPENQTVFVIADNNRLNSLGLLLVIFIIVTLLITKTKGLGAFLGMIISFLIIFLFTLPKLNQGANPFFIAVTTSLLIIPATFYSSHGFNKKTTYATIGTIISLAITIIVAQIFVDLSQLTGFASEEAGFLSTSSQTPINIKSLLLAGIIIGTLGVLDDITVSQASIVLKLHKTKPDLKTTDLYQQSMSIGKDHIASMVNTLILVYTGASLPLLLLFINNPENPLYLINHEIIAEEIVRTLVSSLGLVIAVPITTFISVQHIKK